MHVRRTDWTDVLAGDFAVPPGESLPVLVDDLCTMLAAPDPQVRDDTAYPILAMWTARGVLDGQLAALGNRMADRLGDREIQARTFATMIMAWVVLRDARTGELEASRVPAWRTAFAGWWRNETDLRGWDPRLGWLHAVAHGADTLRAFGRSPRLGGEDLTALLDLAVDRLLTDAGYLYAHGEDERVAYALASVLSRAELSAGDAIGWLDRIQSTLEAGEPGPMPAWASNTLRTLSALHVYTDRGVRWYDPDAGGMGKPVSLPHAAALKERIAAVLGLAWIGLGSPNSAG
jgi:hypothetical protein